MSTPIHLPPSLSDGLVILDAPTLDDAPAHCRGEDAEMRRRFDSPTPETPGSLEQARAAMARWIDQRDHGGPQFAYALRDPPGLLAGGCELRRPAAECAEVSWWLFPDFRHRGLAVRAARLLCRAAFDNMPELRRIEAHIDPDNHASRRVALSGGFVELGEVKDAAWTGVIITRLRYVLAAPSAGDCKP
jgi:RimJ/RimL family protein N-acetyltransferase